MNYAERKAKNPEKFLAQRRIAVARYRAENPEKTRAVRRAWYRNNLTKGRAYARKYALNNPVKVLVGKASLRKRKAEFISSAKDKPCEDCGVKYPPYVMDLDHVRGRKICNVSAMTASASFKRIVEEISKCDVVCSNCHRERTYARKR
jgi:hypothetical protein